MTSTCLGGGKVDWNLDCDYGGVYGVEITDSLFQ